MKPVRWVALGLGSNLGSRQDHIAAAIRELALAADWQFLKQARVYATSALGEAAGGEFFNTATSGLWSQSAPALLEQCQRIEAKLGRTRPYRDAPRTIDIDILWWDGEPVDTATLQIPHPRLLQRAFALLPLLELDPNLALPDGQPLSTFVTSDLLSQGIRSLSQTTATGVPVG